MFQPQKLIECILTVGVLLLKLKHFLERICDLAFL